MATKRLQPGEERSWNYWEKSGIVTPWGMADHITKLGKGLAWATTPGHGGLAVSAAMARSKLSKEALKHGISLGGYYWFEEDVAWAVPYWEVDEWRELDNRYGRHSGTLTRDDVEKTLKMYYPEFLETAGGEKSEPLPKVGDQVSFTRDMLFGRGYNVTKGTVMNVVKTTAGMFTLEETGGEPRYRTRYRIQKRYFDDGTLVKVSSSKSAAWELPIKPGTNEHILAWNRSYWQWEYDSSSTYAAVIHNEVTDRLRLEIVNRHVKSGLGAGTVVKHLADLDLGTLAKPKLGGIPSMLAKHGHDRTRAGAPFKRVWMNPETNQEASLKSILESHPPAQDPDFWKKEQEAFKTGPSKDELIKKLEQKLRTLPVEELQKMLSKV